MKMSLAHLGICLVIAFSSFGCSVFQKNSTEYWKAVAQAKREPASPGTRALFERACGHGNQAACLHVDPKRSGLKLARVPVFQGATGETSTQINVLTEKSTEVDVLLWNESTGEFIESTASPTSTRDFSPFAITNYKYDNLSPGISYRLEIVNRQGMLLDFRHFKTLKPATTKLHFALVSCMNDFVVEPQETMWQGVVSQKPEVMFWIGDLVYSDRTSMGKQDADPKQLWERYVETRRRLPIFYVEQLIPTFTVWDDHDMGQGDGTAAYSHIGEAAKIFRTFFPQDPVQGTLGVGPGLSAEISLVGQRFYLLDDRSFRSPTVNPKGRDGKPAPIYREEDKKNQAHLGAKQEEWLLSRLKMNDQPAWLFMGDQFFGGYHPFESYQGSHPKAFANFLKMIRPVKAPLIFASGDRHLTEIIKVPREVLGYPTFEITSSGIHATLYRGALLKDPSPNQWVGKDGVYNYTIVNSEVKKRGLGLEATALGPNAEVLYEKKWDLTK